MESVGVDILRVRNQVSRAESLGVRTHCVRSYVGPLFPKGTRRVFGPLLLFTEIVTLVRKL